MEKLRLLIREMVAKSLFNWKKYYPTLEYSGNNIMLYHFGKIGIKELNPLKAVGERNFYTPDFGKWKKPRVLFYVHKKDKEQRVDGHLYKIEYPLDKLYPLDFDPLNLANGCISEECLFDKIVKSGYFGLISKWMKTYRVEILKSVPIPQDQIVDDSKEFYISELDKYVPEKEHIKYERNKNKSF